VGRNLYPRSTDLRSAKTQSLTDGQIHYIIQNGVQLTGMPAWPESDRARNGDAWRLVLFIRSIGPLTAAERQVQLRTTTSARYVGSAACRENTDWWEPYYPGDNMKRPTGPTCDGCHSVNYDIRTRHVTEWNVGCERCHGPGSDHVAHPTRGNVINPAHLDDVASTDTCIQCHSQGRPLQNPIEGQYYDWPVGYQIGGNLRNFWTLEDHTLGTTTFTHYADGTAHKNRMQGNDFVQSLMYRRGVTCASCHDVHGTANYAQLRKPASQICLDCHGALSPNGPRTATLEAHTHHAATSAGSECVACHMPKIETTIADVKVSAHTFAFITPAMTDRYQIPNPCTSCHTDKTTAWAKDAMARWDERSPWRLQ
jgi:predicted CXXCH cytochrome family protein